MSTARLDAVDPGVPRRLSVRRGDPHFDDRALRLSDRIAVYLDGVELPEVSAWDVDKGLVIRRKHHADGTLVLSGGVPVHEELGGHVEVRWSKGSAA